jgi:uncharacterized MAPEG superfamily protein
MTTALWCVLIAGLLPYLAAGVAKVGGKNYDNNDPRGWVAKQEAFRVRANAAQQNSWEAFALFTAAVLVAHLVHGPGARVDTLAMVFIAARLVYIPLYALGWGTARSAVWTVGMVCTVWIAMTAAL